MSFNKSYLIFSVLLLLIIPGCGGDSGSGGDLPEEIVPKEWGVPDSYMQSGGYSVTALDNNGDAVIVNWGYNYIAGRQEINMLDYRNGTWSQPKRISDTPDLFTTRVYSPNVEMDNNGNAIIVWDHWTADYAVMISEYRNGNWTDARVFDYTLSAANYPEVAMNDNGGAIIVWESGKQICVSEYVDGIWTAPYIFPGFFGEHPQPSLDGNGNGVIVWSAYPSGEIYSSELVSGVWSLPHVISNEGEDIGTFQFDADDNGNAIVLWSNRNPGNVLFNNEYRNGSWSGTNIVSPLGVGVREPRVAMSNNGEAIMIWSQGGKIFGTTYKSGQWDVSAPISPDGPFYPIIEMDDYGNAILAWNQRDGSYYQVGKVHLIDNVWTDSMIIETSLNTLNAVKYDLAVNNVGEAVIVFGSSDGTDWYQYSYQYQR